MDEYETLYEKRRISLGKVEPSEVLNLKIEPVDPDWTPRQQRVPLQVVMVIEALIAQRDAIDPLAHQVQHAMFDQGRIPIIRETPRQPFRDAQAQIHLAQQHRAAIRTNVTPVKGPLDPAPPKPFKFDLNRCRLWFS